MPKWDKVSPSRREEIFRYNAAKAADRAAAADMHAIAAALGKLMPGWLKKILTDDIRAILARYDAEV